MSREDLLKGREVGETTPCTPGPKEQPILMSTPMVQALLAGTKTETRRDKNLKEINLNPDEWYISPSQPINGVIRFNNKMFGSVFEQVKIPWRIGIVLWIKETWKPAIEGKTTLHNAIRFKADNYSIPLPDEDTEWFNNLTKDGKFTYKSSMFLRRKFARIFLIITDVRIERLHDITEEGAIAEGIEEWGSIQGAYFKNYSENAKTKSNHPKHESPALGNPIDSYKSLWESINGEGSWNSNPFVWVISFSKIENYENKLL